MSSTTLAPRPPVGAHLAATVAQVPQLDVHREWFRRLTCRPRWNAHQHDPAAGLGRYPNPGTGVSGPAGPRPFRWESCHGLHRRMAFTSTSLPARATTLGTDTTRDTNQTLGTGTASATGMALATDADSGVAAAALACAICSCSRVGAVWPKCWAVGPNCCWSVRLRGAERGIGPLLWRRARPNTDQGTAAHAAHHRRPDLSGRNKHAGAAHAADIPRPVRTTQCSAVAAGARPSPRDLAHAPPPRTLPPRSGRRTRPRPTHSSAHRAN